MNKQTRRQAVINQLFAVFNSSVDDMTDDCMIMDGILKANGLGFKPAHEIDHRHFIADISDIRSQFYDLMNAVAYTQFDRFASLCDDFIDFEPLQKLDNADWFNANCRIADNHELILLPLKNA